MPAGEASKHAKRRAQIRTEASSGLQTNYAMHPWNMKASSRASGAASWSRIIEAPAQDHPRLDERNFEDALKANAARPTSTRCAIHGTEMDFLMGNTCFCPDCLGVLPRRQESSGPRLDQAPPEDLPNQIRRRVRVRLRDSVL